MRTLGYTKYINISGTHLFMLFLVAIRKVKFVWHYIFFWPVLMYAMQNSARLIRRKGRGMRQKYRKRETKEGWSGVAQTESSVSEM